MLEAKGSLSVAPANPLGWEAMFWKYDWNLLSSLLGVKTRQRRKLTVEVQLGVCCLSG